MFRVQNIECANTQHKRQKLDTEYVYTLQTTQHLLDDCACFNSECMHSFSDAIP